MTMVELDHAALATVDRQPRAQQRPPQHEEDEGEDGGGGDPAQAQGRAEEPVDDEDAAEDAGAGLGDAGQLDPADGDLVALPQALGPQAQEADGAGGDGVEELAAVDPAEGDGEAHDDGEGQRDGGGIAGGGDPLLPTALELGAPTAVTCALVCPLHLPRCA